MNLVHYYALLKMITIVSVILGTVYAVMEPTTKGYIVAGCIAAIPPTITGVFNHWKIRAVEHKVDGMNDALRAAKDDAVSELSSARNLLSHADGVKEGSDNERAMRREDKKEATKESTPVTITDKSVPVIIIDKKVEGDK